jgi:dTDP-glucose 4,6-dehydratase
MNLLVTGGAGFIGSNFVHMMLEWHPGCKIVVYDELTYAGNLDNLKDVSERYADRYDFVRGDICDATTVRETIRVHDVGTIVNFAAESHVDRSIADPGIFYLTNLVGTGVLLREALSQGVDRFHHVSTDEVYGFLPLGTEEKFTEETPYAPTSHYAKSKAYADMVVRYFFRKWGLPTSITRCSNNFGPWQHPEKFIPRAVTNVIEGIPIPIYGDGLYVRDWLHVLDHVRAIEQVLLNGGVGETYLVGGMTKDVSNLEIAQKIIKIMGEGEIEFVRDRPGHDRRYAVDWSKINRELGWKPRYSFEEGLRDTVQWYQENETWWRPLKRESEEFYRRRQRKSQ